MHWRVQIGSAKREFEVNSRAMLTSARLVHLTIQDFPYFRLISPLIYSCGVHFRSRERGAVAVVCPAGDCPLAPANTDCRRQRVGSSSDG